MMDSDHQLPQGTCGSPEAQQSLCVLSGMVLQAIPKDVRQPAVGGFVVSGRQNMT